MSINRKIRKTPIIIGENPNGWTFEKHEYDLDIIEVYRKLEKLLGTASNLKPDLDKEEYLRIFKYGIECYCKGRDIDFDFHITTGFLIIPSTEQYYLNCLGMALSCWDLYKIRALLSHQKAIYGGKDDFVKVVEFGAYSIMVSNSPFNNIGDRQQLIMQWVEEESDKLKKSTLVEKPLEKSLKKQKPSEIKSVEDLFIDKANLQKIIQILKSRDIINKDGSWNGLTDKNTEVLALIDVLREKRYIKKHSQTITVKMFCEKFQLKLSDRSMRSKTQVYYDNISEYQKMIPDLKF